MPLPCSICIHPDRAGIDRALVGGEPNRRIAARFAVSEQAIRRHRAAHLPEGLADAAEAAGLAEAVDVLAELHVLRRRAVALLDRAERAGDLKAALGGIREVRQTLEVIGEMAGELDRRSVVNVLTMPEWVAARGAILDALRPFPDARTAVADRLAVLEPGS